MASSHDEYWAAVGQGQVTSEVLDHERECRPCSDLRWALEEMRRVESATIPPLPPDLVEEVRQVLGAAPLRGPVPTPAAEPSPLPHSIPNAPHRRSRRRPAPVLGALVVSLVASLVVALRVLGGPMAVPAFADVALTEKCTPALSERGTKQVVVAAVWAGEERERFRLALDEFESASGIDVVFASRDPEADRDLGRTLRSLRAGGCAPDVALLPQPGLLKDLAATGDIRAIDTVAGDLVDRNYASVWRELGKGDDGRLYGVWFKAANKSMIWYNTRAFARAGVEPPGNWQGLIQVAERLSATGIAPFSVAAREDAGWTLTDWFENIYLQTAGEGMYDQLSRHQIGWDHPTVVGALERMAEILKPEWIADDAARTGYEKSVQQVFGDLDEPAAAMVFEADFVANEVAVTSAVIGQDARFFPFPPISGGMSSTVIGSGEQAANGEVGGDVAVLMQDRDEAKDLLRFLASPDAAMSWARLGGFLSPNRNLDASLYPDEPTRRAAAALVDPTTVRFDLSDLQHPEFGSTSGRGMWSILRDFVTNRRGAAPTAQRLEQVYCQTAPTDKAGSCSR